MAPAELAAWARAPAARPGLGEHRPAVGEAPQLFGREGVVRLVGDRQVGPQAGERQLRPSRRASRTRGTSESASTPTRCMPVSSFTSTGKGVRLPAARTAAASRAVPSSE